MPPRYLTTPQAARHRQKKMVEEEGITKRLWLSYRSGRPDSLLFLSLSPEFRQDYFGIGSAPDVRSATLDNHTKGYQGFAFVSGGVVNQLSFPVLRDGPDGPILVGSLSDVLDKPDPVSLPGELRNQWIVSVISPPAGSWRDGGERYMETFPLLVGARPDVVPGPCYLDEDTDELIEGEPPSLKRLELFDNSTEPPNPRFAVLPVLLPIPCGLDIPPGHPVDKPFHWFTKDHFVEIESWRRAMEWQGRKLGGVSCHLAENGLFDTWFLQPDNDILSRFELAPASVRSTNIGYTRLPLDSPWIEHIRSQTEEAWQRIVDFSLEDFRRGGVFDEGFIKPKRHLVDADIRRLSGEVPYFRAPGGGDYERFCLRDMMKGQRCRYGNKCKFRHVSPDEYKSGLNAFAWDKLDHWIRHNARDICYVDGFETRARRVKREREPEEEGASGTASNTTS
jgi:hypothetical protein